MSVDNPYNVKPRGLNPEAQRLLWAMVYNVQESFSDQKPWRDLERFGYLVFLGVDGNGIKSWDVTDVGRGALPTYAHFLAKTGRHCPPRPTP